MFLPVTSISKTVSFVENSPLLTIDVPMSVKSSSHETIDTKRNTVIATDIVAFIYFLNITNLSLLF